MRYNSEIHYKYSQANYPSLCDGDLIEIEQDIAGDIKMLYARFELTPEQIHGLVDMAIDEVHAELGKFQAKLTDQEKSVIMPKQKDVK